MRPRPLFLTPSRDRDSALTPSATEGLTLTGAVRSTYLRGREVYDRQRGFEGVESEFEGKTLL